jgi:hypothetical protein
VTVVTHPNDRRLMIALVIHIQPRPARFSARHDWMPRYVVWTDHERFKMTAGGSFIESSYVEHGFGRMPWLPLRLEPAGTDFWPGRAGEDLVAAHMAIWLSNILLLKETKSATKQSILAGDMTNAARGQAADSETPVELPEGTSLQTHDTSMNLEMFSGTADHILDTVGNNYGMSTGLLRHQGVQSAEARELMRTPVKELRREQMIPLTAFEREFVDIQARVLERDQPDLAFDVADWRIQYGETRTPLSAQEELQVLSGRRKVLLTNLVQHLMDRHSIDADAAMKLIESNARAELWVQSVQRDIYAINGAAGQPMDKAKTPQENGAAGAAAVAGDDAGTAPTPPDGQLEES